MSFKKGERVSLRQNLTLTVADDSDGSDVTCMVRIDGAEQPRPLPRDILVKEPGEPMALPRGIRSR
jgi:hypothetical protein